MRRALAVGALALLTLGVAACAPDQSTVARPGDPVVLTGAQLPALRGTGPGRIVAFRHTYEGDTPRWTQVPVQVDERTVVPFGSNPTNNNAPGSSGTVYGQGSGGPTALQYADPKTFVGADPDSTFDGDDELVFMAADAGGQPRNGDATDPPGVVPGSGLRVALVDPRSVAQRAWMYLFVTDGSLDPSAGRDYVDYDFLLDSGEYKSTYKRADGPNPESSEVTTSTYRIGFSDRWIEDRWEIFAGSSTRVDILDGNKNQFAVNVCGRSNVTFADAEGAFVANIDGPVRAIRSYVGANSGPRTQRTHTMYRDRESIVTDLRVHAIPGVMDFLDYSDAARGMAYHSSTQPGGVPIDGAPDPVSTAPADWEVVNGDQGAVYTRTELLTDVSSVRQTWFYRDETNPPEAQCWGDGSFLGASGPSLVGGIANTDPVLGAHSTLRSSRTVVFAAPYGSTDGLVDAARDLTADLQRPLRASASPFRP